MQAAWAAQDFISTVGDCIGDMYTYSASHRRYNQEDILIGIIQYAASTANLMSCRDGSSELLVTKCVEVEGLCGAAFSSEFRAKKCVKDGGGAVILRYS
jgi:hypothetical protein